MGLLASFARLCVSAGRQKFKNSFAMILRALLHTALLRVIGRRFRLESALECQTLQLEWIWPRCCRTVSRSLVDSWWSLLRSFCPLGRDLAICRGHMCM